MQTQTQTQTQTQLQYVDTPDAPRTIPVHPATATV